MCDTSPCNTVFEELFTTQNTCLSNNDVEPTEEENLHGCKFDNSNSIDLQQPDVDTDYHCDVDNSVAGFDAGVYSSGSSCFPSRTLGGGGGRGLDHPTLIGRAVRGGPGRRGSRGRDGPGGTHKVAREDTLATSETTLGTRRRSADGRPLLPESQTSTREPDRWADIFPPLTPTEEDGTDRDGVSVSAHSSMMEAADAEEHGEIMAMSTETATRDRDQRQREPVLTRTVRELYREVVDDSEADKMVCTISG
ncbi:hypothetical protein ACOMHN_058317 [Nucella lapillus]